MSKLRGLPEAKRMRHDHHFVEQLLTAQASPIGKMIDILLLDPTPGQPRKEFGDLADLATSVKERGVLEPILVRAAAGRFQVIAGERRFRAALEAGLTRVPCIVLDVDDRGVLEVSLIENLQRKDLNLFEEADAIQRLVDTLELTHDAAARKLGRSRPALTETLSLVHVPRSIRERCLKIGLLNRSLLLQIVRLKDEKAMHALLDKIEEGKLNRQEVRDMKRAESGRRPGRPRGYTFKYQAPDKAFRLQIRFGRASVDRDELIHSLERIIDSLRSGR